MGFDSVAVGDRVRARLVSPAIVFAAMVLGVFFFASSAGAQSAGPRFEISFPAAAHAEAITGRAFVMITRDASREPRLQVGNWADSAPFFGVDVDSLKAGDAAVIDAGTLGYPLRSLKDLPAGDYYVQGLMQIYTDFHRSDGHVLWMHMDQWEGQHFTRSPGNLISEVQRIHLDPAAGYSVKLSLAKVIPPIVVPADTAWVKRVKIQSKLMTAFWGRPIYFGATVLLPKGYDEHPNVSYPVVYLQGHFSLAAPFGFQTEPSTETDFQRIARENRGTETGYEFYQAWNSENFPRMIVVTFQHPTPYFDDSYAINSANDGPARRRRHDGIDSLRGGAFPDYSRALGAFAHGRIHRRMGIAFFDGPSSRFFWRDVDFFPGPDRFPALWASEYL